jgi:hypothetical protein
MNIFGKLNKIEVLLFLIILSVFSATASPNFLNAHVRAKIARCYADMTCISIAINSLQIDFDHLPIDTWDDDTIEGRDILKEIFNGVGDFLEASRKTSHFLAVLTSPVSYMSSVPSDPFMSKLRSENSMGFGSPFDCYVYCDVDPRIPGRNQGIQALNSPLAEQFGITPLKTGEYALIGLGPDGILGDGASGADSLRGLPYNATNGIMSRGDIVMTSYGIIGQ